MRISSAVKFPFEPISGNNGWNSKITNLSADQKTITVSHIPNVSVGDKVVMHWRQGLGIESEFPKYILNDATNCELLIESPADASDFSTNIECLAELPGDINQDFLFNIQDIVLLVDIILNNEFITSGDLDFNGVVNILDVIQLIDLILD